MLQQSLKTVLLVLSLLFLQCDTPVIFSDISDKDSIKIEELRNDLQIAQYQLYQLEQELDSIVTLIHKIDSNYWKMERMITFLEIERIIDTVYFPTFIGNDNLFLKFDENFDTMGVKMNDSVMFKIWFSGEKVIRL